MTVAAFLALAASSALQSPAPTLASCMEISFDDQPGVVVFAGTVAEVDPARSGTARMAVEQWFAGERPSDSVVVTGAAYSNEPGVVSSVDWTPRAGEAYVIVGRWEDSGAVVSEPCQQMPVTAGKLDEARAVFGEPLEAPFASPAPVVDPNAGEDPPPVTAEPESGGAGPARGAPVLPAGPIVVGTRRGIAALAALIIRDRRARHS